MFFSPFASGFIDLLLWLSRCELLEITRVMQFALSVYFYSCFLYNVICAFTTLNLTYSKYVPLQLFVDSSCYVS